MIDVLKYDKLIKNIAKKYCYNPNDYEDYVQEGYLVALKLLNKIENEHLPENVIKAKLIIWIRNRLIDMENKLVMPRERGEGMGWMGSLSLVDANYYI